MSPEFLLFSRRISTCLRNEVPSLSTTQGVRKLGTRRSRTVVRLSVRGFPDVGWDFDYGGDDYSYSPLRSVEVRGTPVRGETSIPDGTLVLRSFDVRVVDGWVRRR